MALHAQGQGLQAAQRVDDGKAPLALGAGPIEPIRVAERQGVKQVNTPH